MRPVIPRPATPGEASISVGTTVIPSYDATAPDAKAQNDALTASIAAAITEHDYPASADPAQINHVLVVALLFVLVLYVTMVYGPIAAMLVEMFPTRIRYTSMSLPYHIGNGWFGGFLPVTSFAIVAATGDIYRGLWYPVAVAALTAVIGALFLSDTRTLRRSNSSGVEVA